MKHPKKPQHNFELPQKTWIIFQQRWFLDTSIHSKFTHWYLAKVIHCKTSGYTFTRKCVIVRRLYCQFNFLITMSILLATNLCIFTESRHIIQHTATFFFNCTWLTFQFAVSFSIRSVRGRMIEFISGNQRTFTWNKLNLLR